MRAARMASRLGRWLLAGVLLFAAWSKFRQPTLLFALQVDSYQLLPSWAVLAVAYALPWVELALGLWLLSGWAAAWAAGLTTLLLAVFFGVVLRTYLKGLAINCGCFGPSEPLTGWTVARDGLLLALAVAVTALGFWQRRQRLAA